MSIKNCGCGSSPVRRIKQIELIGPPSDKIETAQDVINSIFGRFGKKVQECDANIETLKKLGFKEPTELKDSGEIRDAFVTAVAEKILEKMEGRVAIIEKEKGCSTSGKATYFIFKDGVKAEETPENKKAKEEFGESAFDGVIEDLIGPIEIMPAPEKPRPKLI